MTKRTGPALWSERLEAVFEEAKGEVQQLSSQKEQLRKQVPVTQNHLTASLSIWKSVIAWSLFWRLQVEDFRARLQSLQVAVKEERQAIGGQLPWQLDLAS